MMLNLPIHAKQPNANSKISQITKKWANKNTTVQSQMADWSEIIICAHGVITEMETAGEY